MSAEKAEGRTVKLFLVDGSPTGTITAEIMNWTGHVTAIPRALLPSFAGRPEGARTGVYLLLGMDPATPDLPTAYIGETEEIFPRLKQHAASPDKDFFDRVIVITSKDESLTKAHAKYLENKLHTQAKAAGNWRVLGTIPTGAKLPESDVADMTFFLRQIHLVLPVLGIDLLATPPTRPATIDQAPREDREVLFVLRGKNGTDARAVQVGGEFVVLQGSVATAKSHAANSYAAHRHRLIETGKLRLDSNTGCYVFTDDVAFSSPSAASATILNRNDNGRSSWKLATTGESYGHWSSAQVAPLLSQLTLEDLDL